MANPPKIETQLEQIIETGYEILDTLQDEDPEIKDVKTLFAKRRRQLELLNTSKVNSSKFSKNRRESLRDLFTRIKLLEKSINNVFAKLSLKYTESMTKLGLHEKAKKSYQQTAISSKFLDMHING